MRITAVPYHQFLICLLQAVKSKKVKNISVQFTANDPTSTTFMTQSRCSLNLHIKKGRKIEEGKKIGSLLFLIQRQGIGTGD